jgi:hypothetical protein
MRISYQRAEGVGSTQIRRRARPQPGEPGEPGCPGEQQPRIDIAGSTDSAGFTGLRTAPSCEAVAVGRLHRTSCSRLSTRCAVVAPWPRFGHNLAVVTVNLCDSP